MGYRNVTLGSARVYHDVDPREGVKRYNEMRLYYAIKSKIVFHKDLDNKLSKTTFFVSLPLCVLYYVYIANKAGIFVKGFIAVKNGLVDGLFNKDIIKYT
ncbi:hypothetical protein IC007_0447 [Sulfuracidifex tepidarius]|uniref:Glycosyltransferase 2-like domain-containing protein n=1 Tax=Sulfuracidifex tepidarius TaxID=1294262 RepID=A0A510E0E6_9CREN|nr:hypothetical protein IC007_0447 [Sulfuracidifex tepidarius]